MQDTDKKKKQKKYHLEFISVAIVDRAALVTGPFRRFLIEICSYDPVSASCSFPLQILL